MKSERTLEREINKIIFAERYIYIYTNVQIKIFT